jgi:RNA polymerase sigma-70 factor (ECF subfamily)
MGMLGAMTAGDDTGELRVPRAANPPTLEALYAAHAASLAGVLHAAGVPDASDAVQEAFVQAVVHWRKVSTYDDPLAWIRRVAINRGHNRWRARRRRDALTERIVSTTVDYPFEAPDPGGELAELITALPPQQRMALTLYYYADLSVAEVADAMELSTGTVKYHLHAARAALARSLDIPND